MYTWSLDGNIFFNIIERELIYFKIIPSAPPPGYLMVAPIVSEKGGRPIRLRKMKEWPRYQHFAIFQEKFRCKILVTPNPRSLRQKWVPPTLGCRKLFRAAGGNRAKSAGVISQKGTFFHIQFFVCV